MGRPDVDSSSPYYPDDPQLDSDQYQEQYDHTPESDFGPSEFNINPENPQENYQSQSSNPPGNDPNQQQFQPPPPPPPQSTQYPPQNPQANPNPPTQPPQQYPPQNPQMNPNYQTQPAQYPPQSPQMNPGYPNHQAQYPPQNPQANPSYPTQPGQYPPRNQQANGTYTTQPQQSFPPQNGYQSPQPVQFPPAQAGAQAYPPQPLSPHKPVYQNGAAYGIPAPQQYKPTPVVQVGTEGWTTGLFDCMEDPTNALTTAFFPCLTFGQVAEIVDNGHTTCGTSGLLYGAIACLIGLPCLLSCTYRTKLRNKYALVEAPAPDWVTHFLCEWCALCQEYRELQNRGLDPSIGWNGNVLRSQQQLPQQAPPMNQTMMR